MDQATANLLVLLFSAVAGLSKCLEIEQCVRKNVSTVKHQMSGDEFVRNFFQKETILRVTLDFEDWPLYQHWRSDNETVMATPVTQFDQNGKQGSDSLGAFKRSRGEVEPIRIDHVITGNQTALVESILIPVVIMSCKDLYKRFANTFTYSLLGANYEMHMQIHSDEDVFFMIIDGELLLSFELGKQGSITLHAGELVYIPRHLSGKIANAGRFLAVRLSWKQWSASEEPSEIQCNAISMYSARIRAISTRNTSVEVAAKSFRLNTGFKLPPVGLGTSRLFGKTYNTVLKALEIGYRLIETSKRYFTDDDEKMLVEAEVGRAIADSKVAREDVFLVVKIPVEETNVQETVEASLKSLRTNYINLVLLELPPCLSTETNEEDCPRSDFGAIWHELERLQSDKVIQNLGICNVKDATEMTAFVKNLGESLSVVYNWFDPLHTEQEIRDVCSKFGIAFMGYGTLGHYRMLRSKMPKNPFLSYEKIKSAAGLQDLSPSTLILRWAMYRNVTVTPSTTDDYHLESNLYSKDVHVTEATLNMLDGIMKDEDCRWELSGSRDIGGTSSSNRRLADEL